MQFHYEWKVRQKRKRPTQTADSRPTFLTCQKFNQMWLIYCLDLSQAGCQMTAELSKIWFNNQLFKPPTMFKLTHTATCCCGKANYSGHSWEKPQHDHGGKIVPKLTSFFFCLCRIFFFFCTYKTQIQHVFVSEAWCFWNMLCICLIGTFCICKTKCITLLMVFFICSFWVY